MKATLRALRFSKHPIEVTRESGRNYSAASLPISASPPQQDPHRYRSDPLCQRKAPHPYKNRPSAIAAEGRYWEPAKGSATFSLPPVFPKKTALLSAQTLGTRNHDTHQLQDRSIRRTSSTVSPVAEHKAGCLGRISRIYRMMYRDSTFSTTFSTSGYFTSTSSTQYSSVLPA